MKYQEVVVKSYKHNGLLHRTWCEGYLLDTTADYYVIASLKTKIVESNGSVWYTKEPAITIYPRNNWYNVVIMHKENGFSFYANIASPTAYDNEDKCYKFIDYDMDIRKDVKGLVRVVDLAEYRINSIQLFYQDNLTQVLEHVVLDLVEDAKVGRFPFDVHFYDRYFRILETLVSAE